MLNDSVANVAETLPPIALPLLRKYAPISPLARLPCPGSAKAGAGVSATIVPAMLSPPTLTGAMPAKTVSVPTFDGSR